MKTNLNLTIALLVTAFLWLFSGSIYRSVSNHT